MSKRNPLRRILAEALPLTAVAVATAMLLTFAMPASAQFFLFGPPRPQPQQQRGGDFFFSPFGPPQQQQQQERRIDNSRAPAAPKRETVAEQEVFVLGDAMADWLASGLEDAFAERPELGVTRKGRIGSGLIRYQSRGEPSDWAAAARGILANENPAAIVLMLGLNDRMAIREPVASATDRRPRGTKAGEAPADNAAKADEKAVDSELSPDDGESEPIIAPERSQRSASGSYEFRTDRWVELYTKKIDELIAIAKSKGVPVLWVGLPAVRGQRATSDVLFLDTLYRDAAGRAGITYVDVWDGFVDESGRFLQRGPDFEGQPRTLRSGDGVYFTKPGARKLAHYVDREIQRLLANRAPVNLPSEPAPEADARPSGPAPRPLAGPVVPLVASSVGTDELLGGNGSRPPAVDALAARTLVKGEPLEAPAGRADDFSWPRREVGRVELGKEVPVAAIPTGDPSGPVRIVRQRPRNTVAGGNPNSVNPNANLNNRAPASATGFFGFGAPQPPPQQAQTTQQQRARAGLLRPPAPVGSSPFGFFVR